MIYCLCAVETCSEVMTHLRYVVNPTLSVVKYGKPAADPSSSVGDAAAATLEATLRSSLDRCVTFLTDHIYELFSIYGEEYKDLISEVPDPIAEPLAMIKDLRYGKLCYIAWLFSVQFTYFLSYGDFLCLSENPR